MLKFLIYGGKGFIGQLLIDKLTEHSDVEVILGNERCDEKSVKEEIKEINPDRVISLIGRTSGPSNMNHLGSCNTTIDYLEDKLSLNMRDNLFAPIYLERICHELNIHFTYLGTGCIYYTPKEESKIYSVIDEPNFFGSSYSTVKGITDRFFRYINSNMLNVRIRMPITEDMHPKNLLTKILTYKKICQTGPNSMTVFEDLFPVLIEYIKNAKTGTIHLVNPGPMRHDEILELYKEIVDPGFQYEMMSESEQNEILIAKRSVCVLDSKEMEENGVPFLKDSIRRIFQNWAKREE